MASRKNKETMEQNDLPPIPDKIYFTIGEVGQLCRLKPHVLRYWEQEFNQLSPSKRRGNRRYYQHKDVLLIRRIRDLLYEQGYTIEGARQQLMAESGKNDKQLKAYNLMRNSVSELQKVVVELELA